MHDDAGDFFLVIFTTLWMALEKYISTEVTLPAVGMTGFMHWKKRRAVQSVSRSFPEAAGVSSAHHLGFLSAIYG